MKPKLFNQTRLSRRESGIHDDTRVLRRRAVLKLIIATEIVDFRDVNLAKLLAYASDGTYRYLYIYPIYITSNVVMQVYSRPRTVVIAHAFVRSLRVRRTHIPNELCASGR